jgi:hypothetical protein
MTRPGNTSLDLHQRAVEAMVAAGTALDVVEDVIEASDLQLNEKAALWMLAWSALGPQAQEQVARAKLSLVRDMA